MTWLELSVSAGAGAIIASILSFLINRQKENRNDFSVIIKALQEENTRLRKEIEEDRERNEALEKRLKDRLYIMEGEITVLRAHLIVLESSHFDHPYPQWMKGVNGEMLIINKSYEDNFLRPIGKKTGDCIGKKDDKIWPAEVAREHEENDQWVVRHRKVWEGYESLVDLDGTIKKVRVVKFPRMNGRSLIGIAGQAILDFEERI